MLNKEDGIVDTAISQFITFKTSHSKWFLNVIKWAKQSFTIWQFAWKTLYYLQVIYPENIS